MALANTTAVTFDGTDITKVTDFGYNVGGEKLDYTGLEDNHAIYEIGITDTDCQITAHGDQSALADTVGDLVIGTTTLSDMLCYKVDVKGTTKGQVMSTLSFCPTTAPA